MSDEVRIERDGPVAALVVDRPAARNAIAPATMTELEAAVEALAAAADVRAVVVCGGGGRFLSGGDLKALDGLRSAEDGRRIATLMHRTLARLAGLPVPVIAAVERYALGGGAEIALACDLRVMDHDGVIGFRQVDFGVTPGWGGGRRLAALVGQSRALHLLWTGAELGAAEAKRLGLADEVAPPGESARVAAMRLAHRLAARPASAMGGIKRLLREGAGLDDEHYARFAADVFGESWGSAEHWACVDTFWRGRRAPAAAAEEPGMPARGRFIVFEGLDGAGTTTQARLLADVLRGRGRAVVLTAEPSGGPVGTLLRQALARRVVGSDGERLVPPAIALLFAADRADHLASEIAPALARGADVICDRYAHSSLAYQGAECDPAWVAALNAPMRAPDLVLYVRVSVEVAAARRAARALAPEIYEVDAFQQRVADGYDAAARWRPADPVVVIDGGRDVEAVHRDCLAAVDALPR